MTVRVHSHNLLLVTPLWERTDLCGRLSVREVWLVTNIEVFACYGKSIVD